MNDLKILLENYNGLDNESKFASISDDIWQLGSLEEIKKEVSHEAFTFNIIVNMIGNWKCDVGIIFWQRGIRYRCIYQEYWMN